MGLLGARKLSELIGLAERVVAIELAVAAQAMELRDGSGGGLGGGTAGILREVRARIPRMEPEDDRPPDVEELLADMAAWLPDRMGGR